MNFDNSSLHIMNGMGESPSRISDQNQSKTFKTELPEEQPDEFVKQQLKKAQDINLAILDKIENVDNRFADQLR